MNLELLLGTTNGKKEINKEHLWLFSSNENSVIVCFVLGNGTGPCAVLIYVYNIYYVMTSQSGSISPAAEK